MNTAAERQRQLAAPILLLVLGVVFIWWIWIWPHIWLSKHHREAKLREKLQNIRPPAGAEAGDVQMLHFSGFNMAAMRVDAGQRDCIAIGTHYRNEFAKAGFGYNGEQIDSEKHTKTFSFAASDYQARVTCQEVQPDVFIYGVSITPQRT
jgi:hypothetical protein